MTDLSLEAPLDRHAGWRAGTRPRDDARGRLAARRREGLAWFALVFAVALPVEVAAWPLRALRAGGLPARGPLRAAWDHAAHVTPIILSA